MSKQLHRLSPAELLSLDLPNWLIIGNKSDSKMELISVLPLLSYYQLQKLCKLCGRGRAEEQRGVLKKVYSQGVTGMEQAFESSV